MKFGDILKWIDDSENYDPEPIGRFMWIGPDGSWSSMKHDYVFCVVRAPGTDWVEEPGPMPVQPKELELVDSYAKMPPAHGRRVTRRAH